MILPFFLHGGEGGTFAELLLDVLLDALKDTGLILLILYPTYFLMEAIEHYAGDRTFDFIRRTKYLGPLAGGILGVIPECGIAGGIASLYSARIISLGAFVAAVMSTSDEMLPVLLSSGKLKELLGFMAYKLLYGIAVGFIVDIVYRFVVRKPWWEYKNDFGVSGSHGDICSICEEEGCNCGHDHGTDCDEDHCGHKLWLAALMHTLKIGGLIFAASVVIGLAVGLIGEERIETLPINMPFVGELIASLIGLVPNCAVSVLLTNFYVEGVIGAGPMMAGLLTNGGVALLVLLRLRRGRKNVLANIAVCAILWVLGVAGGLLATLIF